MKKNVSIIDNSFDIEVARVIDFCEGILQMNERFLWSANVRGENISVHVAKKMKQAGCYNVSTGIESANNNILKRNGKKVQIEEITQGISNLRTQGIEVLGMFIIGNIGDTLETVKESLAYAKNSDLSMVKFYSAIPYQDTPLRLEIERGKGFIDKNILEYDKVMPPVFFDTPEFPYADRVSAIKLAEKEGYFWYCFKNHNNKVVNVVKAVIQNIQRILPDRIADRLYLWVKQIYNTLYWDKGIKLRTNTIPVTRYKRLKKQNTHL